MTYDYETLIKKNCQDLKNIKNKILEECIIQLVSHEINIVYLRINKKWYAIHGEIGSEIIGFHKIDEKVQEKKLSEITWNVNLSTVDDFLGHEIVQVRQVGEAWNGHGFEFSFKDIPDKTIIVQSIYTGSEPKDFADCIRVGVCNYHYQNTFINYKKG
jgi:hypothetical protein